MSDVAELPRCPTIGDIQTATAAYFGVSLLDILSERRARSQARPRQIAMWLARHLTPHSLPTIGRAFRRDHTTVLHAIATIDGLISRDESFGDIVAEIRSELTT